MDAQGDHVTARARGAVVAGLGGVLLLASACADTTPPAGPTALSAWEGSLAPIISTDPDDVVTLITGDIAALVRQSGTEVGIGLRDFENPDLTLNWGLHEGACGGSGGLLGSPGDYTPLSSDRLEATTILAEQLVEGNTYHVAVTDAATDTELACGNLSEAEL